MSESVTYIKFAPVRRLMKQEGATIVASDAVEYLMAQLEKEAIAITKKALAIASNEKRKRITAEDIVLASKM